jgi:4-aminobutyrate aminotransferase-like enzyme
LNDPAGHAEQVNVFRSDLDGHIDLVEIEDHINDDAFVDHVLEAQDADRSRHRGKGRAMTATHDILGKDADHLIRFNTPVGTGATIAVERAQGVWLCDKEGNRHLDGRSQLNCVNLGHSHRRLVRAMSE